MLEAWGRLIYRQRWLALALSASFLAFAIAILARGAPLTSGAIEGLESARAERLVDEISGQRSDTTFAVIFQARSQAHQSELLPSVASILRRLRSDARVAAVVSASDAPGFLAEQLYAPRHAAALAFVTLRGDFAHALLAYPGVRSELVSETLDITCTGQLPFMHDLNQTLKQDLTRAELISLPVALFVLLLVFRTIVASVLPVAVGGLAVVGGIAIVFGLSHHIDIAQYTINVCSLMGLGLAIDYSLFILSRYREELRLGYDCPEALRRALGSAGRVVVFSGLAVGSGLSGLLFFRGSYLFAMGVGGAIVVALSLVFALTFLPALLAVLGTRIHAGKLPWISVTPGTAGWRRVALFVMQRPLYVLVPTLVLLVSMAAPSLHLRLAGADVRVLAPDVEARRGFDRLRAYFPEQAATRIDVVVDFPSAPALDQQRASALYDLVRRIGRVAHVRRVESVVAVAEAVLGSAASRTPGAELIPERQQITELLLHPPPQAAQALKAAAMPLVGEQAVLVRVLVADPPESEAARQLVKTIRSYGSIADGRVRVAGQTASDLDATDYILSRTPHAVGTIVGVTLLALFLLLRSVVLPIKAVLMNFLSIAGSFGALVWIFQDGHWFVAEPRPLEPALPVLLFCILFGLSMDYEVLMLSRMKECYGESGNNTLAVAEGLEKSAGLITSAAAIMLAVFVAFALARVVLIRAVGFGMALAVVLDATLVRVLLVPSTMRLFGRANWWAPRFLGGRAQRAKETGDLLAGDTRYVGRRVAQK